MSATGGTGKPRAIDLISRNEQVLFQYLLTEIEITFRKYSETLIIHDYKYSSVGRISLEQMFCCPTNKDLESSE